MLLAFVLAGALKKKSAEERATLRSRNTLFSVLSSYAVSLCLILTLVAQIFSVGSDNKLAALLNSHSKSYMALTATLHILTLLTAAFAAGYFFFRARGRVEAGLGIAAVCYFVFYTLRLYFDMTMHINNPRWSYGVLTLVFLLLFFVAELDQHLFSEKITLYTVSASLALVFGLSYSAGELAMAIFGKTEDGLLLVYPLLVFFSSAYIAARLHTLLLGNASCDDNTDEAIVTNRESSEDTPLLSDDISECGGDTVLDGASLDEELQEEPSDTAEETESDELTHTELKSFYDAIYRIVAQKRGIDGNSDEEAKKALRREVLAMLSHLLEGDSRKENIENMRAFLKRLEG